MKTGVILAVVVAAVAAVAAVVAGFRRDLERAAALAHLGSSMLQTACGPIEAQQSGSGVPLLVVHGSGGGHD